LKSLNVAFIGVKASLLAAFFLLGSVANAGQFGVRVVDEAGLPVAGASVCFGLPGNYRQFGAYFTDANGQAMAEVPNIPFVVTVSRTRFSGVRLNEPARGYNLIKQVTLVDGRPGPRCKAGSTLAESDTSSIKIRNVEVTADARSVSLNPDASGQPTDYRLSASGIFDASRWQPLDGQITVPGALAGLDEVYLQLRRYRSINGGWLEATSRPVRVYLPASAPAPAM